jgi:hypothetical protein
MTLRHAAALTLIGWYLLAPPIVHDPGHWHPNLAAPLNEWIVGKSFDTATECEKRLAYDNSNAENPTAVASTTEQMNHLGGPSGIPTNCCARWSTNIASPATTRASRENSTVIQLLACGYSAQCTVRGRRTRGTQIARYTDD